MTGDEKRRRALTAEEQALWREIARSIKPLRARPAKPKPTVVARADEQPVPRVATRVMIPAAKPVTPRPLANIDRRERQRLARGRDSIDKRIDLHGMTQAQAHSALARFLHAAQADGARYVLVITGKGGERGGVLRRQVPLWLGLPEFRDRVVGFETAAITHGGEGALYVRLRKPRGG